MKRSTLLVAAGSLLFAACGPAEVVVTAEIEAVDPQTGQTVIRPVSDLEVQLLPYDRDAIFDSLAAAYGTPEPEIPADLEAAREQIAAAQTQWRQLQDRWNALRDSLQTITGQLEQYARGEPRYVQLFNLFGEVEREYGAVERRMDAAFEQFTGLQEASLQQTQEVRLRRSEWADEAFEDVGTVMAAAQTASGLRLAADTTDASGVATFAVKPGQYWVYGRVEELYNELYWNVPLTVEKGDQPVTLTLTRANAQIRPNI